MKYIGLCLLLIVIGFFVGRKTLEKPDSAGPSHSEDLVAQLKLGQKEAEEFRDMAQAPQLEQAQIQKLISQVQNSQYSFLLRRQAAVTLYRHLDDSEWRDLVSKMDTRLKEIISSNPRDLLEGYIHAAAR
jgi:uncharacterized protein YneF (UPF0154 family)